MTGQSPGSLRIVGLREVSSMNVIIGCAIIWLVNFVVAFCEVKAPWAKIIVGITIVLVLLWMVFGSFITLRL